MSGEQTSHAKGASSRTTKLSAADHRALVNDLQDELERWAKRRLWLVFIIASVVGVIGFVAVYQQTLHLILVPEVNRITNSSERQIERYNKTLEETTAKLVELEVLRRSVVELTAKGMGLIGDVSVTLEKNKREFSQIYSQMERTNDDYKSRIDDVDNAIDDMNAAKDKILDNSIDLYNNYFDIMSQAHFDRIMSEARMDMLSQKIDILRSLAENLPSDPLASKDALPPLIELLKNNTLSADSGFNLRASQITTNADYKVVIYIKSDSGFADQAVRLKERLQAQGYRADVWLALGASDQDAIKDIESEFRGAAPTMRQARSGIIVHPKARAMGEQILKTTRNFPLFFNAAIAEATIAPSGVHLARSRREDYAADKVVLVFVIRES